MGGGDTAGCQPLITRSCDTWSLVQSRDVCVYVVPLSLDAESEDSSVQLGDQDEDGSVVSLWCEASLE